MYWIEKKYIVLVDVINVLRRMKCSAILSMWAAFLLVMLNVGARATDSDTDPSSFGDIARETLDDSIHGSKPNNPKQGDEAEGNPFDSNFGGKSKRENETKTNTDEQVDYEEELKLKKSESKRQSKYDGRKQEGISAVRRTIDAASTETCDWKTRPIAFIKGEVCGSHYKVLGIDRKSKLTDKSKIKKKYRQLSLQLHPDKNPAADAEDAFNVLQGAYNCILDDACRDQYDQSLIAAEEQILLNRERIKKVVIDKSLIALNQAHYYISLGANRIFQMGTNFWEMMGEWQVTIFEESYPLGQPLAVLMLLWKGQFLLKLHALSYIIIRVNYEIAKARGWL